MVSVLLGYLCHGDLESERANACLGGRLSTEKEWTRSLTTSCRHGRRQPGINATDDPILLFREKNSLLRFWSDRPRCFVFLYHAIKASLLDYARKFEFEKNLKKNGGLILLISPKLK